MATTSYISLRSAGKRLRVLLCGAGGYVGRNLEHHLRQRNFDVIPLSRQRSGPIDTLQQLEWEDVATNGLPRVDYVINVCGTPIFSSAPFDDAAKADAESSRIFTTGLLAEAIRKAQYKPRAFITASCASYYPPSNSVVYDERYRNPDLDQFGALSLPYFSRLTEAAEGSSVILGSGEVAEPVLPTHMHLTGRTVTGESIYKAEVERMALVARAARGDAEAEAQLQRTALEAMGNRAAYEAKGLGALDMTGQPLGDNEQSVPKVPESLSDLQFDSTPRTNADVRVVNVRMGALIARNSPVVRLMAENTVLAAVGSGKQVTPWIHTDDAMGLFVHAMVSHEVEGALNAVAPTPATNEEIIEGVAGKLGIPFMPFHVSPARVAAKLGSLRTELITASTRIYPAKAVATGYEFKYGGLAAALADFDGEYEKAWQNENSGFISFKTATTNRPR